MHLGLQDILALMGSTVGPIGIMLGMMCYHFNRKFDKLEQKLDRLIEKLDRLIEK